MDSIAEEQGGAGAGTGEGGGGEVVGLDGDSGMALNECVEYIRQNLQDATAERMVRKWLIVRDIFTQLFACRI